MKLKEPSVSLEYRGKDFWYRDTWRAPKGAYFKDVDGELYTVTEEGEPCWPTGIASPKPPNEEV